MQKGYVLREISELDIVLTNIISVSTFQGRSLDSALDITYANASLERERKKNMD